MALKKKSKPSSPKKLRKKVNQRVKNLLFGERKNSVRQRPIGSKKLALTATIILIIGILLEMGLNLL